MPEFLMTRSSKSRRSRAKARRNAAKASSRAQHATTEATSSVRTLSTEDKRYMIGFALLSLVITVFYWWLGGRNLFVFPALFCISVGVRKYWTGPIRRFADE